MVEIRNQSPSKSLAVKCSVAGGQPSYTLCCVKGEISLIAETFFRFRDFKRAALEIAADEDLLSVTATIEFAIRREQPSRCAITLAGGNDDDSVTVTITATAADGSGSSTETFERKLSFKGSADLARGIDFYRVSYLGSKKLEPVVVQFILRWRIRRTCHLWQEIRTRTTQ